MSAATAWIPVSGFMLTGFAVMAWETVVAAIFLASFSIRFMEVIFPEMVGEKYNLRGNGLLVLTSSDLHFNMWGMKKECKGIKWNVCRRCQEGEAGDGA